MLARPRLEAARFLRRAGALRLEPLSVPIDPALIAGVSVAGVGVGLALQGVLGNLVAGLTIIFTKPFRVGEWIEIAGVSGQVTKIELFSTTLLHTDMSRVVIPNRKIVGEILHNYGNVRQLDLSVGVAYGTNLNDATAIVRRVLSANPRVLKEPAPVVGVTLLADSSINIAIRPWIKVDDFIPAQVEINQAVAEQLRAANISIPFPQREVRLLNSACFNHASACALAWCISSWILPKASASAAQSASVVSQPLLNRSTRCASAALKCIAARTCDGSSLPVVQAEPVETAKPALSSLETQRSWLPSGTNAETVFHNRGEPAPTSTAPGSLCKSCRSKFSRHTPRKMCSLRASCFSRASNAASIETMMGTFSVPARCPRSCLPPTINGVTWPRPETFKKADAARPAEFVRRAAEKIAFTQSFRGHLAEPLHGIAEERHFVLLADGQHLAPRLNHAGFVVRRHHGHKSRPHIGHFDGQPVQINHPGVRDGNKFRPAVKIKLGRFHHAWMFDGGNPNLGLGIQRLREMVQRHVVGLSGAARPDDFGRVATQERGEFFARLGHGLVGRRAELVRAGRIAGDVLGGVQPGLARLAHDRRGGVMVKINHRPDKIQLNAALASFL